MLAFQLKRKSSCLSDLHCAFVKRDTHNTKGWPNWAHQGCADRKTQVSIQEVVPEFIKPAAPVTPEIPQEFIRIRIKMVSNQIHLVLIVYFLCIN